MGKGILVVAAVAILLMGGCAGQKHLSRHERGFELIPRPAGTVQVPKIGTTKVFCGYFEPLYEKKMNGVMDSPMFPIRKLLAFNTSRKRFLIVDRENGKTVCRIQKRKGMLFTPLICDSFLVIVAKVPFGQLEVVNLFSGKTMFRRLVNGIRTGPILIKGLLIVGTDAGLTALRFPDLETVWQDGAGKEVDILPVSDGDRIYYVYGVQEIRAITVADRALVWTVHLDAQVASELSLGERLYVGLNNGRLLALAPDRGEIVWTCQAEFPFRGGVTEAAENVFVGGNDGRIYALSAADGAVQWTYQTGGIVTAAPLAIGDIVVVGSFDRYLYSLDKATGVLLDRYRLRGAVTEAAIMADGRLYATCRGRRLYCFEGK